MTDTQRQEIHERVKEAFRRLYGDSGRPYNKVRRGIPRKFEFTVLIPVTDITHGLAHGHARYQPVE